jgi:hypothetical protein
MAKSNKTIETRKLFKRDVAVELSEDQALQLHDHAQITDARADELEERLKEDVKERKLRIATLRAEAERDRAAAKEREQLVSMDCYEELVGSQMIVRRADTNAIVDQRAATPEEQQQTFPGLDDGGDLPLPPDYSAGGGGDEVEQTSGKKGRGKGKGKKG